MVRYDGAGVMDAEDTLGAVLPMRDEPDIGVPASIPSKGVTSQLTTSS